VCKFQVLYNIESFNLYLLSIIDSSICPPNITWANLFEEERKCLNLNAQSIYLLTQFLSPNVEVLILKEHGVLMDANLLWKYIKEKFSETTAVQDSREADCLQPPPPHLDNFQIPFLYDWKSLNQNLKFFSP
jgi:hypothetical protein